MATTHEIANIYWHTMRVEAAGPLTTTDFTYEIDHPYRVGRARIFRLPWTGLCLVIGLWFGRVSEEYALERSIQMREIDLEDIRDAL